MMGIVNILIVGNVCVGLWGELFGYTALKCGVKVVWRSNQSINHSMKQKSIHLPSAAI